MAVAKKEKLDWLPSGWKVEDKVRNGRKVRHFINVKSAKRLYSKAAVLCYIRNARVNNQRSRNGLLRRSPRNKQITLLKEPNDSPEWLPLGWSMEIRTRKSGPKAGAEYKCFTDPSTGKTFYSRPEVLRYLKERQQSDGSSGRKKNDARVDCTINVSASPLRRHKPDPEQEVLQHPKSHEGKRRPMGKREVIVETAIDEGSASALRRHKPDPVQEVPQHPKSHEGKRQPTGKAKVIVETVIDEGLPSGWIKEIRIKKSSNGVRKDPFYYDPTTGYVFRSRLEVLRYLETGEISRHAYKRKDSDGNSLQLTEGRVFPSASAVKSNATEGTSKRRLFAGKGSAKVSYDRGNSKVGDSDGVSAGNNVLLPPGADLNRLPPMEAQESKGNENNTVQIYNMNGHNEDIGDLNKQAPPEACNIGGTQNKAEPVDTKLTSIPSMDELLGAERLKDVAKNGNRNSRSSERKPKRNRKEMALPCRSSKRLAGIEVEPVTNSVAIERVHRSAAKNSDKSGAIPSLGSNQGESTNSVAIERVPQSATKKSDKSGAVPSLGSKQGELTNSVAIGRVLRSATKKSDKSGAIPSLGSKQGESTQGAPAVISLGSQEEIVPAASAHPEDRATNRALRSTVRDEIIKVPRRINVECQAIKDPSGSIGENQRKEEPTRIDAKEKSMIESSRNNIESQMIEEPLRINLEGQTFKQPIRNYDDQMIKQPPTNNSREHLEQHPITYEQTSAEFNRRERGQQDSQISFPWSDPCIEFAFKTLTGAIPLDDNLAIHDYVQHQIRTSADSSKNVILSDEGPPGFCLNNVPLQFATSRQQHQTNSAAAVPHIQQSQPPDATLQKTNIFSPGNCNYLQHQKIRTSASSIKNVILSDEGPPGFCQNNVPLQFDASRQQQQTNSAVPNTQQSKPADATLQKTNIFSPQNHNCLQQKICTSADSSSNVALPDVGPPGFCLNDLPSHFDASRQQKQTNSAVPHIQRSQPTYATLQKSNIFSPQNRNYVQHQMDTSADSINNVTLSDVGPPGFCLNEVPLQFDTSRQQRQTNSAVPQIQQSQPADATLQKTNIFGPQNRNLLQNQIRTSAGRNNNVTLSDEGPPGFSLNDAPLQFDAFRQQKQTHLAVPYIQQSQPADATLQKTSMFSPPSRNFLQSQIRTSADRSNNVILSDEGPPGFCLNSIPLQYGASRQQQQTNSAVPHIQQSQPADTALQKTNIFSPQNRNYVQHQFHTSAHSGHSVTLPDVGPPGFCLNEVPLQFGASRQQQPTNSTVPRWLQQTTNSVVPHTQQSPPADANLQKGNIFSPRNHN